MFLLKKIVAPFFYPLPLCLEILTAGLLLLWFTRRQRAGKVMVTLAAVLLVFLSFSWGSDLLLAPLEHRYPPLQHAPAEASLKWIVILGGGSNSDPHLPVSSRLYEDSLYRILEGVRLYRERPGSKLVLSGGPVFGSQPEAELMAEICRILDVNPREVIVEAASRDTEDQARLIQELVGRNKFILVTAASHMPRALALFKKCGLNPVPAPAGQLVWANQVWYPRNLFPDPRSLVKAEVAVHEYLGLAWAWFKGAI
jgi:uncharacterized SAM-binding protein YcdF (DUF218 family)